MRKIQDLAFRGSNPLQVEVEKWKMIEGKVEASF